MRLITAIMAFSFISSAIAAPLEINRPWSGISDPLIMSTTFVRSFNHLPLEAKVSDERKYWSNDYWALQKGNINYRWNSPQPQGFNLVSPSQEEARAMTELELSYLAPSEKYDLLLGNYHYPLKKEVEGFTSPRRQIWEGMCHGWAPAQMHHNEPLPKILVNPDGIAVPFGSADIKALISYYYAYDYNAVSNYFMGYRCNGWNWWGTDRCKHDMNAGAFHLVLTNKMGLNGQSFVADIERGKEVWNHVPVNYKLTIIGDNLPPERHSADGTVKTVRLKAEIAFVFSSEKNSWHPVLGTPDQVLKNSYYEYTLDIDKDGLIIGGDWKSKKRPDFLWLVDRAPSFKGRWTKLNELLND